MIHWTTSGVVSTPTTVQIRLSHNHESSLGVGLQNQSRLITVPEFKANLQYFKHGLDTTRSIPCHSLTLSGLPLDIDLEPYFEVLKQVLFQFTTVHLTNIWQLPTLVPFEETIDRIVVVAGPEHQPQDIPSPLQHKLYCVIPLCGDPLALEQWLEQSLPQLIRNNTPIVFSYPVPLSDLTPLKPTDIVSLFTWLYPLLTTCKQTVHLKGIPPCLVPSLERLEAIRVSSKTSNRWYVDAEHQCEKARLFFPEILQFHKDDQCRFCTLNTSCDGFFLDHLTRYQVQLSAFVDSV